VRRFSRRRGAIVINRCSTVLALALALAALAAPAAEGSTFTVNPTRVTLSARTASALVSVRNDSDQPVRLELKLHAWTQAPDGQMQLAPTEDLVVFPTLVTLKPGEQRNIRIGATTAFADVEKTYRVFLEELPAATAGTPGAAVRMLTRVGIPVFLEPSKPAAHASLAGIGLSAGVLHFRLRNDGNVYFVPDDIRVRGYSATGAPVVDKTAKGWYVLAGGVRDFALPFEAPGCAAVRRVEIEVHVGDTALSGRLDAPGGACAP
jgi:fimbrial chaperone protein